MRRAVRDYKYEVNEGRMTDECNQYLAQLQKDWERHRIKLGVEALRKEVTLSLSSHAYLREELNVGGRSENVNKSETVKIARASPHPCKMTLCPRIVLRGSRLRRYHLPAEASTHSSIERRRNPCGNQLEPLSPSENC